MGTMRANTEAFLLLPALFSAPCDRVAHCLRAWSKPREKNPRDDLDLTGRLPVAESRSTEDGRPLMKEVVEVGRLDGLRVPCPTPSPRAAPVASPPYSVVLRLTFSSTCLSVVRTSGKKTTSPPNMPEASMAR